MKSLLLSLLASASFAATPHPSLPSVTVPQGLGMNIHFTQARPGELEMLAAAGCRWVRMDFQWGGIERERGNYDFSAYDGLMRSLKAHDMRAVFILDYGNTLYGHERSVVSDEGIQAFARWAAAAVRHFKGQGILWEIWNEPNGGFWHPKANVKEYAALALATSKAMREAVPEEAIIGPATSEVDLPFLEACFDAGLLELWDAVSVHPYRQNGPESAALDYAKLRRLIAKYAPKGKVIPILSGEWGYSSAWHNEDAEKQGKMLPRQWLTNLAQHVPLSIWYDWHEDGTDPKEAEHHFGSVGFEYHAGRDPVYDPKPAYQAAKTLISTLKGFQFMKRLSTGNADDYALLFIKGGEMCLTVWTTGASPHAMKLPASAGEFEVTGHTGKRLPAARAHDGFVTIAATDAPQYLVSKEPNTLLVHAAVAHPLRATLFPVQGRTLGVRVESLCEVAFAGTLHLTGVQGFVPELGEQKVSFTGVESEKTLNFALSVSPGEEYQAGVRIDNAEGIMLELPAQRFRSVPEDLLKACAVYGDGDAKVKSEQAVEVAAAPEPLPFGEATALRISYRFEPGWRFLVVGPKGDALRSIPGEPRAFGCWIFGDGGQQTPRLRVVDAKGQTWQPSGELIRWKGWRYVEFKLDKTTAHWGGTKDDVIHYPLRWDAMLVIDNGPRTATAGTLFCTSPVLIY